MKPADDDLYSRMIQACLEIEPLADRVKADKVTALGDAVDHLYAVKETLKALEHLRRHLVSIEQHFERLITVVYISMGTQAPEKVVTDFVSAEVVSELGTKVPQPSNPVYRSFLVWLGIPAEVINHEVVKVHFPGWCSYYTSLVAQGKDVPEEILSSLTTYDTSYVKTRKRKSMKGTIDVLGQSSISSESESAELPF